MPRVYAERFSLRLGEFLRVSLDAGLGHVASRGGELTLGVGRQNCCSSGILKAATPVRLRCVRRSRRFKRNAMALTEILSQ